MKIFLIGFMGSGKSTTGKWLAEKLGYPFIDLDSTVEKTSGRTIESIFASDGETAFRMMEREMLKNVLTFSEAVIAVGGGAPCYSDNMEIMNRNGKTVYLRMPVNELVKRLSTSGENRPLISGKKGEELINYVRDLLRKREKYYKKAHHTIDAADITLEDLLTCLR